MRARVLEHPAAQWPERCQLPRDMKSAPSLPTPGTSGDALRSGLLRGMRAWQPPRSRTGRSMRPFLWTQKQDMGPRPRAGHAMSLDHAGSGILLFGGDSSAVPFGDTWSWDGRYWTQIDNAGPPPRYDGDMASDQARQRVVLFGGEGESSKLDDSWEWDGNLWSQVADTGPTARSGHAMTFDATRKRIVLFGGQTTVGVQDDTWLWDGSTWRQVADVGPSPRRGHVMAFDSTRERVVLFGGALANGAGLGDTWEWDGNEWIQEEDMGPGPTVGAAMVYAGDRIVLFGGVDSTDTRVRARHQLSGSTWTWDGRRWLQVQDMGPQPRWRHAAAYAGVTGDTVLFGGMSAFAPRSDQARLAAGLLGDTWEHTGVLARVVVDSVVLQPTTLRPGDTGIASFALSGPAPIGGVVVEARFVQGRGDVDPSEPAFEIIDVEVPLGERSGVLEVKRTAGFVPPGDHAVVIRVRGTAVERVVSVHVPSEPEVVNVSMEPTVLSPAANRATVRITISEPAPEGGVQVHVAVRDARGLVLPGDGIEYRPGIRFPSGQSEGQVEITYAGAPPGDYAIIAVTSGGKLQPGIQFQVTS